MTRRKHHTPEQIVRKLHEADRLAADGKTGEQIARELGVSAASYYKWRKQYGSMTVDDAKELRKLREDNARLKRLVAEKELEAFALAEIAKGKF